MGLATRLTLVGLAVLAATLAVVALVTSQLVQVSGRQALDHALRDELGTLSRSYPALLADDDTVTGEDLRRAAQQYLALHPGGRRHLTVLTMGADTFTTRTGPPALLQLFDDGVLPQGEEGRLRTVDTPVGATRVLNSPLTAGGEVVGRAVIVGSLAEVESDATASLGRVGVAGVVGLALGGTALAVATRRAVRPAIDLAAAARATGGAARAGDGPDVTRRVPEPERMDEIGVLAREFNRMLERIAADAEDRRRLVNAVSHELRTPLAVMQGHLEIFDALDASSADGADDAGGPGAAARRLRAVLGSEVERLTAITADLEAIAQGRSGAALEVGPVFVPDLVEELRHRLAGLRATDVVLGEVPAVVVDADQHRLAQAVMNLVDNARTHTPPGTSVVVRAEVDGDELRLEVADDGPGIDPAIRDHIFEPFTTTRASGSTRARGLGLAVVRTLVEAHGGTVEVATSPTGTTATIRLPLG